MTELHCSGKLLKLLPKSLNTEASPQAKLTTWSATYVEDVVDIVVAVNDETKLFALAQLQPVETLRERLAESLREELQGLGVSDAQVTAEVHGLANASVSQNSNRQLMGIINGQHEAVRHHCAGLGWHLQDGRLDTVTLMMNETPHLSVGVFARNEVDRVLGAPLLSEREEAANQAREEQPHVVFNRYMQFIRSDRVPNPHYTDQEIFAGALGWNSWADPSATQRTAEAILEYLPDDHPCSFESALAAVEDRRNGEFARFDWVIIRFVTYGRILDLDVLYPKYELEC